jgi:hypothetical protein
MTQHWLVGWVFFLATAPSAPYARADDLGPLPRATSVEDGAPNRKVTDGGSNAEMNFDAQRPGAQTIMEQLMAAVAELDREGGLLSSSDPVSGNQGVNTGDLSAQVPAAIGQHALAQGSSDGEVMPESGRLPGAETALEQLMKDVASLDAEMEAKTPLSNEP